MPLARRTVLLISLVGVGVLSGAAPAGAAEPIMPLSQVQKGMHCVGRSVISGIDVSTFDVEIMDVLAQDAASRAPYILFRASGPAVDRTGLGPGFSGSPISCPDAAGVMRVVGAVSESIGAYGNDVALATPIELILGEPVDPPAETRVAPATLRTARPLATPLSFGGLSAPVADALRVAAKRAGRVVYAAPPAPFGVNFPTRPLVGGSAMAVGLASGDVVAGAIGTVAYVDGDKVWAFGHPLDAAGRRSLFLQDAYVYAIINNPLGSADLSTYKLASPGHDVGALTNDTESAVTGRIGAPPPSFPMTITGTDLDTKRTTTAHIRLADETALGLPTGASALSQVGALGIGEVAFDLLQSVPLRQSGSMCVKLSLRELPRPLSVCNTYVGSTGGAGAAAASDFTAITSQLDAYQFGPVHVTNVDVDLKLRRSLRQAYLFAAKAPLHVRRGQKVRVRLSGRRVNGPAFSRTISVTVPRSTPLGPRRLQFDGAAADGGGSLADALTTVLDLSALFTNDGTGLGDGGTGPRSIKDLAAGIRAVNRYDGVSVSFPDLGSVPSADGADPAAADSGSGSASDSGSGAAASDASLRAAIPHRAYRDPELRLSGIAYTTVIVGR